MLSYFLSEQALRRFANHFGDTYHTKCPICEGSSIDSVWKIPFGRYPEQWIVSFGPETVIEYYACDTCESVFKNPYDSTEHELPVTVPGWGQDRITRFAAGVTEGYRDRYNYISPYIPKESKIVIDAACGGAEYLQLIRDDPAFHVEHFVGLELAPLVVQHVKSLGFDGRQADLKSPGYAPDLEGRVDCVIFSEVIEHVIFPLRTLRYLVKLLRPGGTLWFSAQRAAPGLLVRMGEDCALTQHGVLLLAERLNCAVVKMDPVCDDNPEWYVVFQKPQEL